MNAVTSDPSFPILTGLRAGQPYPPWREQLMLFGQLVGVWDMDVEYYDRTGACTYHGEWEWSFAWILDGRAIQDHSHRPFGESRSLVRTAGDRTFQRTFDAAVPGRWPRLTCSAEH